LAGCLMMSQQVPCGVYAFRHAKTRRRGDGWTSKAHTTHWRTSASFSVDVAAALAAKTRLVTRRPAWSWRPQPPPCA
jgi:hypothetical protein